MIKESYRSKLWIATQAMAVLMVFAAPVSRALFNLSAAMFLCCWLLSGGLRSKMELAFNHPIAKPFFVMIGIMLIGIFYTPAPRHDVIEHVRVYSKFLLVLMLIPVFADDVWRRRGVLAFTLAMMLTVVATYVNVWFDPPWSRTSNQGFGADHSVFVDYIVQGVATSIFLGLCIYRLIEQTELQKKLWLVAWVVLAVFSLVFLIQGRSGQFTLIALLFFIAMTELTPRYRLAALAGGVFVFAALIYLSPLMTARMVLAYTEAIQFFAGARDTSVGMRMDMWQFSFRSMLEDPLFGKGTAAYHILAEQYFGHCNLTCFHPHNQYLFFGMEHGIPGLLVYLWMLWVIAVVAKNVPRKDAAFLWCVWVVLVVDGLANAPLWYRMESYIFYTLLGVGLAAYAKGGPAVKNDRKIESM